MRSNDQIIVDDLYYCSERGFKMDRQLVTRLVKIALDGTNFLSVLKGNCVGAPRFIITLHIDN